MGAASLHLLSLAPFITKFKLECDRRKNIQGWKNTELLSYVKDLTLKSLSGTKILHYEFKPPIQRYTMPYGVEQCSKTLTKLKLTDMDLSKLKLAANDLPCLKDLEIEHSIYLLPFIDSQDDGVLGLLLACQSSLEVLKLNTSISVNFQESGLLMTNLRKLELKNVPCVDSLMYCTPNLEDLTLELCSNLNELHDVAHMLKYQNIRRFKIKVGNQRSDQGMLSTILKREIKFFMLYIYK